MIEDLDELFGLVCDCGYGFVLSTVSELRPDDAKVVSIQFRQGRALRKLAAKRQHRPQVLERSRD